MNKRRRFKAKRRRRERACQHVWTALHLSAVDVEILKVRQLYEADMLKVTQLGYFTRMAARAQR